MGTMKNTNNNDLASTAANLCMELEHTLNSSNIVEALTYFLVCFEDALSEDESAQLSADIERLDKKPTSYVYAGWARTTLADIWRTYR